MPAYYTFENDLRDIFDWFFTVDPATKTFIRFFQTHPLDPHKALLPKVLHEQSVVNDLKIYAIKAPELTDPNREYYTEFDITAIIKKWINDVKEAIKRAEQGKKSILLISPFELKVLTQVKQWDRISNIFNNIWGITKDITIAYGAQNYYYYPRMWNYYLRSWNSYYAPWNYLYNIGSYFYNEANSGTGYLVRRTYSANYPYVIPYDPDAVIANL